MILDTNIVIYACQPGGEWLGPWTTHPEAALASVTRIEALGYPGISPEEETAILDFIRSSPIYALDDEVIEQAIHLRQQKKMKLGDAIIAATAMAYGIPLVTRNEDDFKHIAGLDLKNPFAIAP
ncbi:MAG: type II toxin-antitoxin system VapC family toxin [Luteolibacter sp.]|uniref:type II toxin-antitoxin system VapC family toxin n=1 Tax=Luteolibacter sp. TaxID=1962973 RepID=UPI003266D9BA